MSVSSTPVPPGGGLPLPGAAEPEEHPHPSVRAYIEIAAILTVITAVEVVIWYIESVRDLLIPMLIILSFAKFLLVVGYFMHLKFDDRRFAWLFGFGLVMALFVFIAFGAMFFYHNYQIFFG